MPLCSAYAARARTVIGFGRRIGRRVGKGRLARPRSAWRTQLWLFLAAYAVYNLARWVFVGDLAQARDHARWIVALEEDAGLAVEAAVQRGLDSGAAGWLASNIYLAAQLVVLPGSLVWLYRRAPEVYRPLRNTILATWLIAVPIYAFFPVAPPRLADLGIADTVSRQTGVALSGRSTLFYNELAAVPSLHVGFAAAIAVALAVALRRRSAKALALLWAPAVSLSVVATGNHYIFDIVAGLVVTALGFAVGRLPGRLADQRLGLSPPFESGSPAGRTRAGPIGIDGTGGDRCDSRLRRVSLFGVNPTRRRTTS